MVDEAAPVTPAAGDVAGQRRWRVLLPVAATVLVLDQITKVWAVAALSDRDIDLVGSLRFHLERNSGAAFSVAGGRGSVIAFVALAVVVGLLWFGRIADTVSGAVALALVLGGAVGNLVDRFTRTGNAVVDFIDVQWWPVFNVADIGVTIGGVLLVLDTLRDDKASSEP